jgi:acyl-CoA synthetase (NDP forming)/GNAT superfamily N-acetyltransferase
MARVRNVSILRIDHDDADVLAADGVVIHLRDLGPGDLPALEALHARASDRSIYLRYFSLSRPTAARYLAQLAQSAGPDHHTLGAFGRDGMLGVGVFERINTDSAEFALLVADDSQHDGIGTLLLEHLVAAARGAGISRLLGEVLSENARMIEVIRRLGFPCTTATDNGSISVEITIAVVAPAVPAIESRERSADIASLRPMLAPRSVVVVGAGRRAGSVGHEILRNIRASDFNGAVYVVNPHCSEVLGVASVATPLELPVAPDLAIVAVPAAQVPDILAECGQRGCRSAVVVGAGFGEAGAGGARLQDEALAVARSYGMRLLGPNCIGLVNTDPDVRLDATFGALRVLPGHLAVMAQSGAFGVGLVAAAAEQGLGISQFVSVGNKADVGGNDLLLAWADDPRTYVIGMYLESVGDPRRFARVARQVARIKPIIAVKSGRTGAGQRAGRSHTAAAASPDAAVDALLRASGVLRLNSMAEMVDAARVLTGQPLPLGPRVAIVGNSGGPEILAADASADAGLVVVDFGPQTRDALLRAGAAGQNPIDLGAAAQAPTVEAVLRVVHASPDVDAVVTVFTDIAVTDVDALTSAVVTTAAESTKPTVAVEVGAAAKTVPIPGSPWSLPIFTFPEAAVAALGIAHRYAGVRREPIETPVRPAGVDQLAARAVVESALAGGAGWLAPDRVDMLLSAYGIPSCPQRIVHTGDEAARTADDFGYPVALKLAGAGLHKTDVGGVRLGLGDEAALRAAVGDLLAIDSESGVLLQPMVPSGVELIAGGVQDSQFGPLVMLGAGGVLTDVLRDRTLRLAPITDAVADEMIGELRSAPLLDGYRGTSPVSRQAVRDVLVRLATLLDDLPEVAELDLNPLICRGEQVLAVDARARVESTPQQSDSLLRRLRQPARNTER